MTDRDQHGRFVSTKPRQLGQFKPYRHHRERRRNQRIICDHCGESFGAATKAARYCSSKCAKAAYRERRAIRANLIGWSEAATNAYREVSRRNQRAAQALRAIQSRYGRAAALDCLKTVCIALNISPKRRGLIGQILGRK